MIDQALDDWAPAVLAAYSDCEKLIRAFKSPRLLIAILAGNNQTGGEHG